MASRPRKRPPFSSPHALSPAIERAIDRVERSTTGLDTLHKLFADLRSIAPEAFTETRPPDEPQACYDRQDRIRVLEARAQAGLALFHDGDVVHLSPDSHREGGHHRQRRRRLN